MSKIRLSPMNLFLWSVLCLTLVSAIGAESPPTAKTGPKVFPASTDGELAIKKFKPAPGLKVQLYAAEPFFANPVCFSFDEKGRIYVVETFRLHAGVTDIRGHMTWLDDELASKSTEGLEATFKKFLGAKVNELTNNSERISLVEDRDGDGKADHATVFAEGFNSMVDGIAAGVLARKGNVYFTDIPNVWVLRDNDGDGKAEYRKSLHYGFGVRVGFLGHDLHGLRIGPDGKLYFSIGDRGSNIKTGAGNVGDPETGCVFRCNLDGSNLEVFATGLRNPQELTFDRYGNLFTGDNNSDGGDQARWVYLVEGGDSGWRVGWQFIERPNARGPWNAEKMWHPQWEGQPAHLVPPIANIANGPSGVTYYPGIGLGAEYDDHFFLADFKGSAANSLVHSFALKAKGATFQLIDKKPFISNILVTDVEFGPDGRVYVSDWVDGWNLTGKGRIYALSDEEAIRNPIVAETKKLIAEGMDQRSEGELEKLLAHPDQRVRQEAQFALAERAATPVLIRAATSATNQMARLHGIWGLGQVAAAHAERASAVERSLVPLLADADPEVRAQAAKIAGDGRFASAYKPRLELLPQESAPRAQFFAALALGKIGKKEAVPEILKLLRANQNRDAYLRHAGVMALLWIRDLDAILAAGKDDSAAVRLAALLALRRLHHAEVARFLDDADPQIVLEAARAVNDSSIYEGIPKLAGLLKPSNDSEPFLRRAINANFRLGTLDGANRLAAYGAASEGLHEARTEALQLLAQWGKPPGRDQVTGLWRPLAERDDTVAREAVRPLLPKILEAGPTDVRIAAVRLVEKYNLRETYPLLYAIVADKDNTGSLRVAALKVLGGANDEKLSETVSRALGDTDEDVRKEATRIFAKLHPQDATAQLLAVLETGSVSEQQNALTTLGTLRDTSADRILSGMLEKLSDGKVKQALQLDLIEAAGKRSSAEVKEALQKYEASLPKDDPLAPYRVALAGGNKAEGKTIFFERPEASCLRCHKVGEDGGEVGPPMNGIGTRQRREYLLESIVLPNKQIAQGFETILVTLKNGTAHAGTLRSENDTDLVLNSPEDGVVTVKKSEIEKRERGLSGMPEGMGEVLSKQDLRNLIEYLSSLK